MPPYDIATPNWQIVELTAVPDDLLARFERHQITTRVIRLNDGVETIEDDHFEERWDDADKQRVTRELRACLTAGGTVIVAQSLPESGRNATDSANTRRQSTTETLGFATIEPARFGPNNDFIEMRYLHVSESHRGRGIGKALFRAVVAAARRSEAPTLYIGAHPNVATQAFYRSCGCTPSDYVDPTILAREPTDIQLVYSLRCDA